MPGTRLNSVLCNFENNQRILYSRKPLLNAHFTFSIYMKFNSEYTYCWGQEWTQTKVNIIEFLGFGSKTCCEDTGGRG